MCARTRMFLFVINFVVCIKIASVLNKLVSKNIRADKCDVRTDYFKSGADYFTCSNAQQHRKKTARIYIQLLALLFAKENTHPANHRPLTSPAWPFSSASSHWTRSTPRPGWPWRRPALPPPSPVFPHSADLKRKFISIASTPGFRRLFSSNYSLCLSGLLCRWRPLWNRIKYSKNESDAIRTYGSTFSRNFRKRELPNPKKVQ